MSARTFGVEIEFYTNFPWSPTEYCTEETIKREIKKYTNNESWADEWKLKRDGSVSGDARELVSPILSGTEGLKQVHLMLEALRNFAFVNETCGLHVHIGAHDLSYEKLVFLTETWLKNKEKIDCFLHPRRIAGRFSRHFSLEEIKILKKEKNLKTAHNILSGQRYYHTNIFAFLKHKTVEFRGLEGTLDPKVLLCWIRILLDYVDAVGKAPEKKQAEFNKEIYNTLAKTSSEIHDSLDNNLKIVKLLTLYDQLHPEDSLKEKIFVFEKLVNYENVDNITVIQHIKDIYERREFYNISSSKLEKIKNKNSWTADESLRYKSFLIQAFFKLFHSSIEENLFVFCNKLLEFNLKINHYTPDKHVFKIFDDSKILIGQNIPEEDKIVFNWRVQCMKKL